MSTSGEERLRSSATDDQIQLVIDTTPALIHTALPDGSLDYFNQGWLTFLGLPLEEVRGWRWTRSIHAEDREAFVAKWREALATGEPFGAESRVRRADGQYRWLLHRKVPLRDASGAIVKWYGSSIDIEDHKEAEERARQQERELRQIVDLVPHHVVVVTPDGTGIYGNEVMLDYYGLKLEDITGPVIQRFAHPDDRDAFIAAWQRGFAESVAWQAEARFRRRDGEYRWFLTRVTPLRDDAGRIVRWYATGTDIEDRKRAEEKTRQQERELREILDLVPHHIAVVTPDGTGVYGNQVVLDYYGVTLEDVGGPLNARIRRFVHPDDIDTFFAAWERGSAGTVAWETEGRFRRRDGEYRWFLVRVTPLRDDAGRIVRWYSTATDIEDRKQAEERARQQERELRQIIDLVPHHVAVVTPDGTVIYGNEVVLDYYGLKLEDLTGPVLRRRAHPDDVDAFTAAWQRGFAESAAWQAEVRFRRRESEYRWFLVTVTPLRDDSGRIVRWYVTGTDIDDRKRAEEALRESEEKFRLVVDGIDAQVAANTPDGEVEFVNQRVLDYFGKTLEELKSWRTSDAIHPDDRSRVITAWRTSIETGQPYEADYRIRRSDGVYRWFHTRGRALRGADGAIARWYVLLTDIDDRKRAEERVRQDERELRTIVDFLPQLLIVADPQSRVVYANRASLEFTGRTLEETAAHPDVWSEIVHSDDLPSVRASLQRLAEGIGGENEFRLRRSDGQYRWILTRNAPLPDAEGRVIGWFAAGTDIDDRKRAEQRMHDENLALREEVDRASLFEEIVGGSPSLCAVLTSVAQVAPTDSTVLITGETGTGKELVARAIHKRSPRATRAFVSVNCAAIPPTLIASELFGHEKGAFTGALQRRAGRFELADGGTIFLDEIGDLPPDTQLALLRVLQEREFERVGSTRPIKVDVRIIAATNRDLKAAIEADAFRTDLFYRLNVFPIEMPPLRERISDIPVLVEYFVDRYARQVGKTIRRVDKRTLDLVKSYGWPGNVRELQNVIERAVIICDSGTLTVDPRWLSRQETAKPVRPLGDELTARERQMIETALAESRGRVAGPTGAAAMLGLHPSTLDSKIRALRIDKQRFKRP